MCPLSRGIFVTFGTTRLVIIEARSSAVEKDTRVTLNYNLQIYNEKLNRIDLYAAVYMS